MKKTLTIAEFLRHMEQEGFRFTAFPAVFAVEPNACPVIIRGLTRDFAVAAVHVDLVHPDQYALIIDLGVSL